jgi:membrane associated rhomboid family serine protease
VLIIAANTLMFFVELNSTPAELDQIINTYGLVPAQFHLLDLRSWLPLFTNMFLHGGWFHFLSNMWILYIFGDNVEDRFGPFRYLLFYILGGLSASLLQVVADPGSNVPAIGASGAIAAVLGAYFLFYPRARVITFIPVFIIPWFVEIPAVVFLGFWFISQIYSGLLSLATASGAVGGIAWWAHIGGFIFGVLIARLNNLRNPPRNWYPDEYHPW